MEFLLQHNTHFFDHAIHPPGMSGCSSSNQGEHSRFGTMAGLNQTPGLRHKESFEMVRDAPILGSQHHDCLELLLDANFVWSSTHTLDSAPICRNAHGCWHGSPGRGLGEIYRRTDRSIARKACVLIGLFERRPGLGKIFADFDSVKRFVLPCARFFAQAAMLLTPSSNETFLSGHAATLFILNSGCSEPMRTSRTLTPGNCRARVIICHQSLTGQRN